MSAVAAGAPEALVYLDMVCVTSLRHPGATLLASGKLCRAEA